MQADSQIHRATEDRTAATGVSSRVRAFGAALLAAHLLVIGWLTLRPVSVGWTYPANLTPFASVGQALRLGGLAGCEQLAAGLLPLAPLGLLLPLVGGGLRTAWLPSFLRTVGGGALLATAMEILEGWTPGHVLNVDDITLGTIGVAACHLTLVPLARTLLRRRPAVAPRPAQVRLPLLPAPADQHGPRVSV
ncbi:VanZ family protein [Kitasatospora sp. NPDC002227]|uniref:VanZ family protein n=1 Tax=Kitasatospora sp. NPDC002227 TaxID=3154773 RepID=UPI003324AE56